MATSGSTDYSLNARQLVAYALKKLRITPLGETMNSDEAAMALEELNVMLKGWQLSGPNLWRQTFGSVTLVASTASYTLSPRPIRVYEARYRNASSIDLPMGELNRADYVSLPSKSSTGTPTQYFIDYQRAAATMYVWPVPASVTSETIQYTYQRIFEDLDSLNDDIDIPQEYLAVVGYQLADRLQEQFAKEIPGLSQRAAYLLAMADAHDRESIVRFEPNFAA